MRAAASPHLRCAGCAFSRTSGFWHQAKAPLYMPRVDAASMQTLTLSFLAMMPVATRW
jgi:hypothetical protein